MEARRPECFYKYVTGRVAELVLQNRTLRWSTPALLNDPFDIQFDLHVEVDREKLRALTLEKFWHACFGADYVPHPKSEMGAAIKSRRENFTPMSREEFDRMHHSLSDNSLKRLLDSLPNRHAEIRAYMSKSKILCLSGVGDSLLMWSYYAENHQGAALRFESAGDINSMYRLARPIVYSKDMPRLFNEESLSDMSAGLATIESESMIDQLVYTKAEEWKHEQEWRLLMGYGREPDQPIEYIEFGALELDAVILGCAMPEDCRASLTHLAQSLYPHVKVVQAEKSTHEFRLVVPT